VRNTALHDQLRAFAERAAARLTEAVESGLEVPFEVDERPGQTSVLYHYKPLSDQFVRERFAELRRLEGFGPALLALGKVEGISAYLRVLGASYVPTSERDRAEAVLRELLARVWEEVSAFELDDNRFDRAYREFESVVYENTVVNTVMAPLPGVRLAAERLDLGAGIELVRGDLFDAPPEAIWAAGREEQDPNTLVVMTVEATPQNPPPLTAARLSFRKLLTALRLLKPGGATLGTTAWWRLDSGPWQSLPLGFAGRARSGDYWLEEADRQELVELFELIRVRPLGGGALRWALTRFEMGCEQPLVMDGLSDHLLAVRALLDGGENGPAGLSTRLAVLCAEPAERAQLAAKVEQAFEVERLVMRGQLDGEDGSGGSPDRIAHDLEGHLRAILRDMVCGYLDPDVRRIADELLMAESAVRPEPRVEARGQSKRKRKEPRVEQWDDVVAPELEPEQAAEPPEAEFSAEAPRITRRKGDGVRQRVAGLAKPVRAQRPAATSAGGSNGDGEQDTQEQVAVGGFGWSPAADSQDWGFDDDPQDFSAAI
jgi:hypothetical protein